MKKLKFLTSTMLLTASVSGWAQVVEGTRMPTDPTNAGDVKALLDGDNLKTGDILDFTVDVNTADCSVYNGKDVVIIGGYPPEGAQFTFETEEKLKDLPQCGPLEEWQEILADLYKAGTFKKLARNQKIGKLVASEPHQAQFKVADGGLEQIDEVVIPSPV